MDIIIAFGIAGVVFCIGFVLRVKVKFLRKMLIPTSVISGAIGFVLMNSGLITVVDTDLYMSIVNVLFILIFTSIGLSSTQSSGRGSASKGVLRGTLGLSLIFSTAYAVMAIVGLVVILVVGAGYGMNAAYGMLITFGFGQGPGQAFTFGSIMENQYGLADAATVGMTFASIGFLVCFIVGVPLARWGIRKGLARNLKVSENQLYVERGYYTSDEKRSSLGKETMYSGNIDTLTFHFAVMGVCVIIGLGLSKVITFIPSIGPTLGSLVFLYCMIAAHLVKFIMKKLEIDYLLDNRLQTKITGWGSDYLVVSAFMGISINVIAAWIVPIIILVIIVTMIVFAIVLYFTQRLGASHDFERTLALFGMSTGTVPSGLALVRIVDPNLKTSTAIELGLVNIPALITQVTTAITILAIASGSISITIGLLLLAAPIPVYLILLKALNVWGERTYSLRSGTIRGITVPTRLSE